MILGRLINFEKYFMELEIKPNESYLFKISFIILDMMKF